jgi:hypothetical protein
MAPRRYGKSHDVLPDPWATLEVEVVSSHPVSEFKLVTLVRATLSNRRYVRVAEAKLETPDCARRYAEDLHSRRRQGLDPLSGMDPVRSYTVNGRNDSDAHAPAFAARAAG